MINTTGMYRYIVYVYDKRNIFVRVEEAGVPVPDELCQVPAGHGHHGSQHLRQGLRGEDPPLNVNLLV